MSWTTLSIIGSAGRNEDAAKVSKERFDAMVRDADNTITKTLKLDPKKLILVSGGAAFGDHVAVKLFLDYGYAKLRLFLPSAWRRSVDSAASLTSASSAVTMKRKYSDETKSEVKEFVASSTVQPSLVEMLTMKSDLTPPGFIGNAEAKRAQGLHEAFGKKLGYNTLIELEAARLKGAEFTSRSDFKQRNKDIACSTHLLAYTFATGTIPKVGGSSQTWNMWKANNKSTGATATVAQCIHRPILSLSTSPTSTVASS